MASNQSSPTSFSDAKEHQAPEEDNEPLELFGNELQLWSPPPPAFDEGTLGILPPIDEWTSKVPNSECKAGTPEPPSPEIHQVLRKLEERIDELKQQLKTARKELRASRLKNRRRTRTFRRDFDFIESRLYQVCNWGSCLNDVIAPILDERLEKRAIGTEESGRIEDFFSIVDDYPSGNLTDDSD